MGKIELTGELFEKYKPLIIKYSREIMPLFNGEFDEAFQHMSFLFVQTVGRYDTESKASLFTFLHNHFSHEYKNRLKFLYRDKRAGDVSKCSLDKLIKREEGAAMCNDADIYNWAPDPMNVEKDFENKYLIKTIYQDCVDKFGEDRAKAYFIYKHHDLKQSTISKMYPSVGTQVNVSRVIKKIDKFIKEKYKEVI